MDTSTSSLALAWIARALGVTAESVLFLLCLFASVPFAALTRAFSSPTARAASSVLSGAFLCFVAYGGWGASVRLWAPTVLTFAVIRLRPRDCGFIVFAGAFAYLLFCHVVAMSGDVWRRGGIDFTGTLMVFTLKLVGCAMDVQDGQRVKGEQAQRRMYCNRVEAAPALLPFLGFVFFPGAVLVGPIFSFKDYNQYLTQTGVWDPSSPSSLSPSSSRLSQSATSTAKALLVLGAYLVLQPRFPSSFLTNEGFFRLSFAQRWMYSFVTSFAFRLMYYFLWSVSEVAMVVSDLGYSGPSTNEPFWSRAINANILQVELWASASQLPAFWNIGVARWLRTYVYDRLVQTSGKPTVRELMATQIVSALWHGLYPGYYLFFVNAAIAQHASKVAYRTLQVLLPQPSFAVQVVSKAGHSLFKQLMINYAQTGFLLLQFDTTIAVWRSLYFIGTILPLVLSFFIPLLLSHKKQQ